MTALRQGLFSKTPRLGVRCLCARPLLAAAVCSWLCMTSPAELSPHFFLPTRSSESFNVQDARLFSRPPASHLEIAPTTVVLDPDILLLSAERVRRSLVHELGLGGKPFSKVQLVLNHTFSLDQDIRLVSSYRGNRWQYMVEVPDQVDRAKLVRAIVKVTLLEYSNRMAGGKSAEIPLWLVEGACMHLLHSVAPDLIPQRGAPSTAYGGRGDVNFVQRRFRGGDALQEVKSTLQGAPPFSFAQLCHPTQGMVEGESFKIFQSSAQLFFAELMRLPEGAPRLRTMLQALPAFWNWELAFLHAFKPLFPDLLEVEKWWTLSVTLVGTRGPLNSWRSDLTLGKLGEILATKARISFRFNDVPTVREVPIQTILQEWDYPLQRAVLQEKIVLLTILEAMSGTGTPEPVRELTSDYRALFQDYLQSREQAGQTHSKRPERSIRSHSLVRNTVRRLNELDERREALWLEITANQLGSAFNPGVRSDQGAALLPQKTVPGPPLDTTSAQNIVRDHAE
jgi:hypothetical protein